MSILSVYAQKLISYTKPSRSSLSTTVVQAEELVLPKDMRLKIILPNHPSNLPFIFFLSGDGGWTKFDQSLSESLAAEGFPLIGLNSKVYFWRAKTPDQTTREVSKVIQYYQALWKKENFVLIGYSFGADVIPFLANRLDSALKKTLHGVLGLSPDQYSDFEVQLATLLNLKKSTKYNVLSEFKNLKTVPAFVFFGSKEDVNLRSLYINHGLNTIILTGNHHFNYDYPAISKGLINAIPRK